MQQNTNPRRLALDLLNKCEAGKSFSNIAIDTAIRRGSLSPADRALLTALFYGAIEKKLTLDYIIDSLSSIPKSKIEKDTRNALRLGIYQLAFMDKIPSHAAVNETVSLVGGRSRSFVNAILRRYLREADSIVFPARSADITKYLSVKYSVAEPLVKALITSLGEDECESFLSAISKPAPITLRTNTLKISRDALIARLADRFPNAQKTDSAPEGVLLGHGSIADLDEHAEGLCFVQDEASQIATAALGATAGDIVIDACACPGSKTFGAAISMNNEGEIFAFDIHENKLSLICDGASRLGISIISAAARDARDPLHELIGKADRVICDVPCSGFGVMAKKPELRYKDPAESERLPDIQLAILESCSKYLRAGGVLVYSTCTVLSEENESNVKRFLDRNPEFALSPFSVGSISAEDGMITLMPDRHKTDGFFIARLVRKEKPV